MNNVAKFPTQTPKIEFEICDDLDEADLNDLCDATDAAIENGGGFGWLKLPSRDILERFWKGIMMIPERHLIVARLDGVICGTGVLIEPSRHNEAGAHCAEITSVFVSPWARGHGIAKNLINKTEDHAKSLGYNVLKFDILSTQTPAIRLYEYMGYKKYGEMPEYARIDNQFVSGFFYSKEL